MEAFICTACGTQYTPSSVAPRQCVICEEERQYVPPRRTNLDHTRGPDGWTFQLIPPVRVWSNRHWNTATICDRPTCAGCLHTQWKRPVGLHCVLWDCIAMLDPATIALINGLGSLKAIAVLTGLVLVGVDRVGDVHFFASNAFTRFSNSPNRRPISCTPLIILWTWSGNMFGLFSLAKLSMALTKVEMDMTDLHLLLAANLALASTR